MRMGYQYDRIIHRRDLSPVRSRLQRAAFTDRQRDVDARLPGLLPDARAAVPSPVTTR